MKLIFLLLAIGLLVTLGASATIPIERDHVPVILEEKSENEPVQVYRRDDGAIVVRGDDGCKTCIIKGVAINQFTDTNQKAEYQQTCGCASDTKFNFYWTTLNTVASVGDTALKIAPQTRTIYIPVKSAVNVAQTLQNLLDKF